MNKSHDTMRDELVSTILELMDLYDKENVKDTASHQEYSLAIPQALAQTLAMYMQACNRKLGTKHTPEDAQKLVVLMWAKVEEAAAKANEPEPEPA